MSSAAPFVVQPTRLWLVTLLIFITLFENASTTKFVVIGHHIDVVNAHPGYVRNASFSTQLLNRTARTYSVEVWLQPNVTIYSVYLRLTTFYRIQNSYRQLAMLNFETDACAVFAGTAVSMVFGRYDLRNISNNVDGGCPYKELIYLRKFVINTQIFASYIPFLPTGQWRLDHGVYTKAANKMTQMFSLRWFFEAKLI